MAAKARVRQQDFSWQFWSMLLYACSECWLIILLFVAAVVSYVATRFARIYRLQAPCMLCSRLDHDIHGKAWFSEDLVCAAHKLEISCLSYCQSHNRLTHSDDLCERCLLSCTALVGRRSKHKRMVVNEENSWPRSKCTRICSCCSEPFKMTRHSQRLSEIANGRVLDDEMSNKEEKNITSVPSVAHCADNNFNHLPQADCSKPKVSCDSVSQIRFSNVDDVNALLPAAGGIMKDVPNHGMQRQPVISRARGVAISPVDVAPSTKPISTTPPVPSNAATSTNGQPKAVPEKVPAKLPKETFLVGIEEVHESDGSHGTDVEATEQFATSANDGAEKLVNTRTVPSACVLMDRNNSLRNAFGGRGNLQSPRLSEIISVRQKNSRTQEEVKSFLSQMSSARGFDSPCSEVAPSPRMIVQTDEQKQSDATSGRPSLERNNSMLELFDVNLVSEIEGESVIDHLKRQIELDRNSVSILYKDLEAERSASAVAASEAMAMINRLQEEKAVVQMEALQYLRMMEEQAEYDQEAIQKLNDLLTEREKEILDMDAELENYQSRLREFGEFGAIDTMNNTRDGRDVAFEVLNGSNFMRNTLSDFENEKPYVLQSLRRLEEKLSMSSRNRIASNDTNTSQENGSLAYQARGDAQYIGDSQLEGGISPLHQEHPNGEVFSVQRTDVDQSDEENHWDNGSCSFDDDKTSELTSLRNEISILNTRFKALEADQKFVKQILSSLNCSSDGVQCVQEIIIHLRELRRTLTEQTATAVF